MSPDLEPLVLDLVEWVAREPRSYADVMDAWRTSCPRLTVWEDAVDDGLLVRSGQGDMVAVTPAGVQFLRTRGAHACIALDRVRFSSNRGYGLSNWFDAIPDGEPVSTSPL
jgi:hypothetical protein